MIPEIKAWREFSKLVEERLREKSEDGYSGWDDIEISQDICADMTDDCLLVERGRSDQKTCVDIAARAMMMYRFILNREGT